jgi:hypothetical protein
MDWLGSDHVGTPKYMHETIEELCFLCVVRAEKITRVVQLGGVVE